MPVSLHHTLCAVLTSGYNRTSLDELPPSIERSCTSAVFSPLRAAAIAAQVPAAQRARGACRT
jgi:hypothetical protein